MKTPEEQFEPLRQEYLNEKFPGDLAKLVDIGASSSDEQPEKPSTHRSVDGSNGWTRVGWMVAAVLLLGVTLGTLWWTQGNNGASTAKLDPVTTETKATRRRNAIGFFQPSRTGTVRLTSTSSRAKQQRSRRLLSRSTFSSNRRQASRTSFWGSSRSALAQNQPSSSNNSPEKKRTTKPGQRRPKFRNLFRFEPIQYRRS